MLARIEIKLTAAPTSVDIAPRARAKKSNRSGISTQLYREHADENCENPETCGHENYGSRLRLRHRGAYDRKHTKTNAEQ